ncbi:PREDICTED: aminopeptidase N-like, partial [Trachymyrmex cornetzi]|uniref:aminopeptidase N-like n=1 Tax=Trachymyrmex cornetzi TaxID=471704 RepID=UPI00084ED475
MNVAHISSTVIFIIAIIILNSKEVNNFSVPKEARSPYNVTPVHYHIEILDYTVSKDQYADRNAFILDTTVNLDRSYGSFVFHGKTSTTINILESTQLLLDPHIQENGMRQLFPCWDEPHFKATFNISISHPRFYSALSNMPTKSLTYDRYSDLLRTNFHITPPMSTLQVAIVVTDYYGFKINENITLWSCICYSVQYSVQLECAQRIITDITSHLKSEFSGINIPKMDHVAIPNFPQDGTSKWGLIFHTEANLICDKQSDSIMHQIEVARLIASKIAYQWFSNVFSYNWWTQFWLHDGLATLFGEETIVKIFNDSKIMDFLIVQNQYESLHLGSYFDMNPQIMNLLEIDSLFSFPRHLKSLIVLRMLQSAITDKVFRKNVHTYVNRYSMVSFDFWSMQEPIEAFKCYIPSDKFLTWITYRHYQIVTMEQAEADSYTGRLSQKNIMSQKYNPIGQGRWWILINLKNYKLRITETLLTKNFTTCLTPDSPSVTLYVQQIDWAYDWIVNIQRAGYYRVKYNLKGWNAIANYLNSTAGEYEGISVINRAKIIDDAFHLMMENQLDVSIFWNLTQFLSQETNYVVWYPMIKVFEYMSTIFPFSKDEIKFIDDIKAKLRELLNKPLMAILFDKHIKENGFTESFKQEILKWSCALKHIQCAKRAKDTLEDHLQNPEIEPEANLICDKQSDSIMHQIEVARLIASKIAYQWFSNVFSYNWWTQFWLHDGLATLFGEETIVKIFNDSTIMDFLIVQNQYESLHLGSYFDMNPQITNLLEIDSLFSFPRYLKALIALRMLQSAITDKVFRKNVRTYVNRYSTVSFDFWSMQEPIEAFKCYIPSDKFLTWVTYRHYQTVKFEQEETDSYTGRLLQMYNPIGQERWWIPINLKNYKLRIAETFMENLTTCLTPDSPSVTLYVQQIDWAYDCIVNIQRA